MADGSGAYERQPVEHRPVPVRVSDSTKPLGAGGHGPIHADGSSASASMPASWMAAHCAACSTMPFERMRLRSTSARTTIPCTGSTSGTPTCVLRVTEVKSVPYVPMSHPFVERLIGTLRRECLDRMLFWSAQDLEQKLFEFQDFYNAHRAHASLEGRTPVPTRKDVATLHHYRWAAHCRGLSQTPIAA